jgi:hypothetical protein
MRGSSSLDCLASLSFFLTHVLSPSLAQSKIAACTAHHCPLSMYTHYSLFSFWHPRAQRKQEGALTPLLACICPAPLVFFFSRSNWLLCAATAAASACPSLSHQEQLAPCPLWSLLQHLAFEHTKEQGREARRSTKKLCLRATTRHNKTAQMHSLFNKQV